MRDDTHSSRKSVRGVKKLALGLGAACALACALVAPAPALAEPDTAAESIQMKASADGEAYVRLEEVDDSGIYTGNLEEFTVSVEDGKVDVTDDGRVEIKDTDKLYTSLAAKPFSSTLKNGVVTVGNVDAHDGLTVAVSVPEGTKGFDPHAAIAATEDENPDMLTSLARSVQRLFAAPQRAAVAPQADGELALPGSISVSVGSKGSSDIQYQDDLDGGGASTGGVVGVDYPGTVIRQQTGTNIPVYCANPTKPGQNYNSQETYTTINPNFHADWVKDLIRSAVWYGPGGPGYSTQLYDVGHGSYPGGLNIPNPNGVWKRNFVFAHMIISDAYTGRGDIALAGLSSEQQDWARYHITGFIMQNGQSVPIPEASRADCLRYRLLDQSNLSRIPGDNSFRVFVFNEGSTYQPYVSYVYQPLGKLQVQKQGQHEDWAQNNPCYNKTGAVYEVFSDAACTKNVGTLTVAKNDGWTNTVELPPATYYVREKSAATGYGMPSPNTARQVSVNAGATTSMTLDGAQAEPMFNDPLSLVKAYTGLDNVLSEPLGNIQKLSGIQFKFDYYKGYYNSKAAAEASGAPAMSAVWATDNDGYINLQAANPVSGTWSYKTAAGYCTIPLGTLVVTEVPGTNPDGLVISQPYQTFQIITDNSTESGANIKPVENATPGNSGNAQVRYENDMPKAGLDIVKADYDLNQSVAEGDATLAGVKYEVVNRSANPVYANFTGGKWTAGPFAPGAVVTTITTSKQADSQYHATLPQTYLMQGTYEVREVSPSTGYGNAQWTQTFTVDPKGPTAGTMFNFTTSDTNWNANKVLRYGINVGKVDRETKLHTELGEADLDGATFNVINRSKAAVTVDSDGDGTYEKLVAPGEVCMNITVKETEVDGETRFIASTGDSALPYGTYEVKETGAGTGYLFDSVSKNWSRIVTLGHTGNDSPAGTKTPDASVTEPNTSADLTTAPLAAENQVQREDFSFSKKANDTGERLANVPFIIESQSTGERHVIVTDENGMFMSDAVPHTPNTNANDPDMPNSNGAITVDADGNWVVADDSKLDCDAGLYFTGLPSDQVTWADDGASYKVGDNTVAVNNDLRTFPYDVYTVSEMQCAANEGYAPVTFTVTLHRYGNPDGPGMSIDYGTVDDNRVGVTTEVSGGFEGYQVAPATENTKVTDTVMYDGLTPSQNYTLRGELHVVNEDGTDGGVVARAEATFTPKMTYGTVPVEFTFDATNLSGKHVVAFETLYQGTYNIASHADLTDEAQTLYFPEIGTSAAGAVDNEFAAGGPVTITDTVSYSNLQPNKTYTVSGELHKQVIAENGTVTDDGVMEDANGNPVTATTTFTPTEASGTVDVVFTFDCPADAAGNSYVVFETLKAGDVVFATHADITDEGQTVTTPEVETEATDAADGDKEVSALPKQTVIDTVKLDNLVVGREYTVTGTLHKQTIDADGNVTDGGEVTDADGNVITATTTFTAEATSQTVELKFENIDGSQLAGDTLVAFETLSRGDVVLGSHTDITDEKQTVTVPKIGTTLVGENGAHEIQPGFTLKTADNEDTDEAPSDDADKPADDTTDGDAADEPADGENGDAVDDGAQEPSNDAANDDLTTDVATQVAPEQGDGDVTDFEKPAEGDVVDKPADDATSDDATTDDANKDEAADTDEAADETVHVKLTDTVAYENVKVDTEYMVTGTLHVAEVDAEGKITDAGELKNANGDPVMSSATFTAAEPSGTVDVVFEFDAKKSDLVGKSIVAFESMSSNGRIVANHEDITDEGQTVDFIDLGTSAIDKDTGTHTGALGEQMTIVDTVSYTNLTPGKAYTMTGTLHVKGENGKDAGVLKDADGKEVTATTDFTPETADGTVDLTFEFKRPAELAGSTVVAFEDLSSDGIQLGSHADITDEDQSVHYPKIGTEAKGSDGNVIEGKDAKVTDTVHYTNLVPGETYTMTGWLVNKETGDAITDPVEVTFVPEESEGDVEVVILVDATKFDDATQLVAFEECKANNKLVAEHKDVDDEAQTVIIKNPEVPATPENPVKETADKVTATLHTGIGAAVGLGAAIAALAGSTAEIVRRRR